MALQYGKSVAKSSESVSRSNTYRLSRRKRRRLLPWTGRLTLSSCCLRIRIGCWESQHFAAIKRLKGHKPASLCSKLFLLLIDRGPAHSSSQDLYLINPSGVWQKAEEEGVIKIALNGKSVTRRQASHPGQVDSQLFGELWKFEDLLFNLIKLHFLKKNLIAFFSFN